MSYRNLKRNQGGYSLLELLIVIVLISVVSTIFITLFSTSTVQYFKLQKEATNFTDLAFQSQRISKVLRGLTDVTAAGNNEITVYAYFAPTDQYVSQIRYYRNTANTAIMADVTNLTSNPPVGTLIPSSLKTYTVFSNYKQVAGVNLFTYLNSAGAPIATPIADLRTIKGIRVNLAVPKDNTQQGAQTMTQEVSLRNRKTNL